MITHEIIGEFRRNPAAVKASTVLSTLVLIVSGCGDSGNSGISKCPSPEYYRDHSPVKASKVLTGMRMGVSALRNKVRISGYPDRNVLAEDLSASLRPAAEAVFRKDKEASALVDGTVLIVGNKKTDTSIDEIGEVVCEGNGGQRFLTEEAETAIADLSAVGIDVLSGSNNTP